MFGKMVSLAAREKGLTGVAIAAGTNMYELVGLKAALDASDMTEIDGTWQQFAARPSS